MYYVLVLEVIYDGRARMGVFLFYYSYFLLFLYIKSMEGKCTNVQKVCIKY